MFLVIAIVAGVVLVCTKGFCCGGEICPDRAKSPSRPPTPASENEDHDPPPPYYTGEQFLYQSYYSTGSPTGLYPPGTLPPRYTSPDPPSRSATCTPAPASAPPAPPAPPSTPPAPSLSSKDNIDTNNTAQ